MNHLWRWKAFTIPGPVLNYGGPDIGGAQFMPVPPPKNPGCPIFGVGMPHGEAAGDALTRTKWDNQCSYVYTYPQDTKAHFLHSSFL